MAADHSTSQITHQFLNWQITSCQRLDLRRIRYGERRNKVKSYTRHLFHNHYAILDV